MTRAPIKLSRELKLLLLLLLMVALLGAWFVWTNNRAASGTAQQGATPVAAGPVDSGSGSNAAGTNVAGNDAAGGNAALPGATNNAGNGSGAGNNGAGSDTVPLAAGNDTVPIAAGNDPASSQGTPNQGSQSGALAVQPNRPVEVEVIPPFPTPQVEDSGTAAPVTPGGINPQASLAAVPRNNPFRPLSLDPNAQTATAANASTSDTGADTGASGEASTAPLTPPSGLQPAPTEFGNAGPLAISPIPGAGGSLEVSSGDLNGLPAIPGANGNAATNAVSPIPGGSTVSGNTVSGSPVAGSTASGRPASGNTVSGNTVSGGTVSGKTPDRTVSGVTVIGGSGNSPAASGNGVTGNAGQDNVIVTAPKPIVPPVAGVRVPSVNRVPVAAARPGANGANGNGANGNSANGNSANGNGAATTTRLPTSSAPQIIAELAQAADAGSAAASVSKLDQLVQSRGLAFNAAVLGPVNTAIFRSQDGYVVVAVGQNLPDSQITVKEVNATSATLSLGNDLKTLELDQR